VWMINVQKDKIDLQAIGMDGELLDQYTMNKGP